MSNLEFLYELRNFSQFSIASEDAEFTSGFPFEALNLLQTHHFSSLEKLARALAYRFLESYSFSRSGSQTGSVESSPVVMSVIENHKLETLVTALNEAVLPAALSSNGLADLLSQMKNPAFVDLGYFLPGSGFSQPTQVKANVAESRYGTRDFWIRYRTHADNPLVFVGASEVASSNSHERYSGLNIANPFLPILTMDYYNLEFYRLTRWTQK